MELDKIISGDSAVVLQSFPPDCIDLTVTSPPYDNLRTYNGFTFDFETIARELFRVTKSGGVVVWVVGDATVKGSETLTSFRQALHFHSIGFNVHDTMIYRKQGGNFTPKNKYYQVFEYMFIFSKGVPKTFNPIQVKRTGHVGYSVGTSKRGTKKKIEYNKEKTTRTADNVWVIAAHGKNASSDEIAYQHPAIFPEALAQDHIISWSNENDTVLDCFCGSGTTPKMAKLLNRHYIGIDTSAEYVALANERLAQVERGLTPLAPDLGWVCGKCKTHNADGVSLCGFCDTPRLNG